MSDARSIPQDTKAVFWMVQLHDNATQDGRNFDSLVESSVQYQEDHS